MDSAAWIPLYATETLEQKGVYGVAGYRDDYFGCGTVAFPVEHRELVKNIGWKAWLPASPARAYSSPLQKAAWIQHGKLRLFM